MRKNIAILSTIAVAAALLPGMSRAQSTPAASTPQNQPAASSQQTPAQKSSASKTGAASAAKKPAAAAAVPLKTDKDKGSYAIGANIGRQLHQQGVTATGISSTALLQGLRDALADRKLQLTDPELHSAITAMIAEAAKAAAAPNKAKGDAFLAANKSKTGVVVLPSGLQYKILSEGAGPKPAPSDTVNCNYRGTLIDGTEFDSSAKHGGQPAKFPVTGVIKGWTEALQLMPVGSKWQLFIPPDLAYGDRAVGGVIGPGSTLVFEVELVSIDPKPAPPAPKQ